MKALSTFAIAIALFVQSADISAAPAQADLATRPPAPGEGTIASRILAPCCSVQTLDAHESELARELRLEIRGRLYAGESAEAIEQSLVDRYGERVRAAPKQDPMRGVAGGLLVVAALAAAGVVRALRRSRARAETAARVPAGGPHDVYDDRLDDELRALD